MIREYAKTQRRGSGRMVGILAGLAVALGGGCTTSTPKPVGPELVAPVRQERWDPKYPQTRCQVTAHYRIYTDIDDPELLDQLSQLMEGAFVQYLAMTPGIPVSAQPLRCYVFARRDQWAAFTAKNAGQDAPVFLRITRGAYTVDDWFVAFWLGDRGTCTVAVHEGWHQFVARNYAGRIPPALEEGIACMFEDVSWEGRLPRWNIGAAPERRRVLARAMESGQRWALDTLLRLHAGDVIGLPKPQIETFYAQTWALAMFLWEGDNGRYRPALQRYLGDAAVGRAYLTPDLAHLTARGWHPIVGGVQLSHYLGMPLPEIERAYERYCASLINTGRADD